MNYNRNILRLSVLIPAVLILLSACGPGRKAQSTYVSLDTLTISASDPINIYRATATRHWDITHTRAALSFDFPTRTAIGRAWITVHPYFYESDTLELDAKGMKIDSVVFADSRKPLKYTYEKDRLKITFDKKYRQQDTARIYIRYTAQPYHTSSGGSKAITDDRGLYFVNHDKAIGSKPVQIWTQGETEANSHWLPTIDKPNERMTMQLELTVPDTFQTLSNGKKIGSISPRNGLRTDTWAIDKPIQIYAVMFAIGEFAIVKDEWNGKEVSYYVEHEYAPYARYMFKNTPEMIDYFSKVTNVPYPWNKYSQVVVRDYVSGAMENTTASLFGEFMNQDRRENADKDYEDIVSHEVFHQWFGDYVTAESWSNLTVNESFANYGEQIWRKYKYGAESVDRLAYEDLQLYIGQSKNADPALLRFHYPDKETMFDRISYQKGGAILRYMHALMGDEAFYKAMNLYLVKNALQPAEATHWRLAVEDVTGQDWNWFFNQWYNRGGHPALDVDHDYDDASSQLIVTVKQTQPFDLPAYRLPLKTAVIYGDEKTIVDWTLENRKEVFTFPYKNGVKPVIVPDVEHWLPGTIKENKKPAQWLAQYRRCDDYVSRLFALQNSSKKMSDSATQALIGLALDDKMSSIREATLKILAGKDEQKYKDKWGRNARFLAVNDANNKVRTAAFDLLGKWKVTEAKEDMLQVLNDSSYSVAGAALKALHRIAEDTAYILAKTILKTQPRANLQTAAWDIVGEEGADKDVAIFEAQSPYVYGTRKIQFAASVYNYLQNVKNEQAFERGLKVLTGLTTTESIKVYRVAIGSYVFNLGKYYKEQKDSAEKQSRIAKIKTSAEQVMKQENEEENLEQYKKMKKEYLPD